MVLTMLFLLYRLKIPYREFKKVFIFIIDKVFYKPLKIQGFKSLPIHMVKIKTKNVIEKCLNQHNTMSINAFM
jgi:hypothetical protein